MAKRRVESGAKANKKKPIRGIKILENESFKKLTDENAVKVSSDPISINGPHQENGTFFSPE